MNSIGMSKIGLVRQRNEDRFFIDGPVCAVTDGMGGYKGGEIASTYAVDEIERSLQKANFFDEQILCDAIRQANASIVNRVKEEKSLTGMGTTAVVVAIQDNILYWASVGDSRLYVMKQGILQQITTDHSMVQDLFSAGVISTEDMLNHQKRNLLNKEIRDNTTIAVET